MAKKSRPTSFLPDDVVGEVLLRLPSKSLARFCSVCRSWKHLISSPAFVESHQALAAAKRPTKFAFAPTAPPHRWSRPPAMTSLLRVPEGHRPQALSRPRPPGPAVHAHLLRVQPFHRRPPPPAAVLGIIQGGRDRPIHGLPAEAL